VHHKSEFLVLPLLDALQNGRVALGYAVVLSVNRIEKWEMKAAKNERKTNEFAHPKTCCIDGVKNESFHFISSIVFNM
jgi:hypothetical protein